MSFQPSVPHPEFDGIFEANDDSHICPQIEEFNRTLAGDLDCLRLNIFVPPTASPTNKLPVLVWIFGGRFELGFYGRLLYGPKFLVRHDIILVTINYRVGPYGFMCLNIPEVPGNQGLKDQLMALRWLHENIEAFGMEDIVKHFFYGDEVLDEDFQPGVDLSSDISFIYPSIRSLKRFVESEAEKVYLYIFSYSGGRNFIQHRNNVTDASGAWHADEIGYLFDISYMEEPTPEDQLIVDRMTTMWANFVKSG
ncbi:Uncharacterized protein OBRU01_14496 [Operophtera brumata]|uniref:Carboxylesterase type B domain-containing protein n=1 Tax=Operophtera brumata TaxID=104452 RepID=A0A0L7L1Y2_OPEBR|nr:Uncharacterized protein OBRU01_14496 [Operophtera brumata]